MSRNKEAADLLAQIATLLELLGENRFKVNAHARAARAIESLTTDAASMSRDELKAIDGVGEKVADKLLEFFETGSISELDALSAKVPSGLAAVLDIQGLGPKTVRLLWQDLKVESVDDLKRVIDDGSILDLPRMGQKTVDNISKALTFASKSTQRTPLGIAMPIAESIVGFMLGVKGVTRAEFAGSLRRGRDSIGDIDILCVADDPEAAGEAFRTMQGVTDVLAAGSTKSSVRISRSVDAGRWKNQSPDSGVQVDLRIVPEESWGAALMYFTGSKEHNVRLRERAQKQGLTLNEYGLFPDEPGSSKDKGSPQSRGVTPVAGATERDVFESLGVAWLPPEAREDRGELNEGVDDLITVEDIKAELHAHTTASDGVMSMPELVQGAKDRGYHTIAVTDHSRSSAQANGLSVERLRAQIDEVRELDATTKGIRVISGSEVDILKDGTLDYDDDLLAALDIVVASPHAALSQKPAEATRRLLKAIENPYVDIVGHPTGRLVGKREGLSPAMDEIISAAVEHRTALEINAHWMRLDLRDTHVRAAVEAGCLIAIDCDTHAPEDMDNIRYGVMTGRRGWLTPDLCVNTWSKKKLGDWLARNRA